MIQELKNILELVKEIRRNQEMVIENLNSIVKTIIAEDDHDCHIVGGGGESGCNNPIHDIQDLRGIQKA